MAFPKKRKALVFTQEEVGKLQAVRRARTEEKRRTVRAGILLDAASTDRSLQLLPWLEREFTLFAMKRTKGNQVKAAKLLGVTRATLRKRIERYGITRELNFQ